MEQIFQSPTVIISMVVWLFSVGVTYGVLNAFMEQVKMRIKELELRIDIVEKSSELNNVQFERLNQKMDSFIERAKENWDRIFKMLDNMNTNTNHGKS